MIWVDEPSKMIIFNNITDKVQNSQQYKILDRYKVSDYEQKKQVTKINARPFF